MKRQNIFINKLIYFIFQISFMLILSPYKFPIVLLSICFLPDFSSLWKGKNICAIKRTFFETLFYLHPFQTFSSNSIKRMCLCINKWWYHLPTNTQTKSLYMRVRPRARVSFFSRKILSLQNFNYKHI